MEILNAVKREKKSNHEAKKERRNGKVPGVLYGKNMSNLLFEIAEMEISKEIENSGEHGVITVNIDGQEHKALIKEVQKDPVNRKLMHIDLESLNSNSIIVTEIPISFIGEDNIIKDGKIFQKERNKVKVQCAASNMPKTINADISNLKFGDTYRLMDIEVSDEITFIDNPNTVIGTVVDGNTSVIIKDTPNVSSSSNA
ncbi:LSU ribosomal protein L25P [Clostridium sp. USBA 49]|uniref:50S ribosomal protein L25 n=1 Tax=Clostridium TaxID=1485 RepID=UPI00099A0BC8|nr:MULTISPECIES: 50S ribosomal protein L25 [Clostridium]SKA88159.1 LSU ribosomal protein L25P [Clostridium sp. USBA 49]